MSDFNVENRNTNANPFFIVMEGIDGSGKSTQCELLKTYLEGHRISTALTREPGGTELAEKIREITLNPDVRCNDRSEMLLFMASRSAHVEEIIKPALKNGKTVICDRFYLSTFAYQGYGRGLNLNDIGFINEFATSGLRPDITFVFDIDAAFSLERTGKTADRFEDAGLKFMIEVAEGYRELVKTEENCYLIDASMPVGNVFLKIKEIIDNIFGLEGAV